MRHVCKDMSQGINPELSDEVREGKKKRKKGKRKCSGLFPNRRSSARAAMA